MESNLKHDDYDDYDDLGLFINSLRESTCKRIN